MKKKWIKKAPEKAEEKAADQDKADTHKKPSAKSMRSKMYGSKE